MDAAPHLMRWRRLPEPVAVGLGGGVGALGRASVTAGHPVAALLLVNLSGCLVVGLLAARLAPTSGWRPLLVTGLLGGWTTWSGVAVLVTGGGAPRAALLLGASLVLGPVVTVAGMRAGRPRSLRAEDT